ncbi:MAG: hypothetical protein WBW33_04510, partial [Bryobacteraceae bacterium]
FVSFGCPSYFLVAICMVVGQNRDNEIIGEIARRHDVPFHIADTYEEESRFYQAYVELKFSKLYPVLFDLYLLTTVSAVRYADAVLDMSAIGASQTCSAFATSYLLRGGINLALDDCNIPVYPSSEASDVYWHDYEGTARSVLLKTLGSQLSIPYASLAAFAPGLSRYSLELLGDWSGNPSASSFHRAGEGADVAQNGETASKG